MTDAADDFEMEERPIGSGGALVVDLEGYEGPIDMLLVLARQQKVDLLNISILQLAEQYLKFIEEARRLRLEIAADYLVMAAWLADLKSKLLLPADEEDDEPSGPEMAEALAFQLRRLEAMIVAMDAERSLLISGEGDLLTPDGGVISIGSGASYATAAARAYIDASKLGAAQIVKRSLLIAADMCIYTNTDIQVLEL